MKYFYNEDNAGKTKRVLSALDKKKKVYEKLVREIDTLYPKIETMCKNIDNALDFSDLSQILSQIKEKRILCERQIRMCEKDRQEIEKNGYQGSGSFWGI